MTTVPHRHDLAGHGDVKAVLPGNALHFAAGQLFQARAHDRHAIQEQRNTAQQRGDVCNVHKTMLLKSSYCSIAQDGCA